MMIKVKINAPANPTNGAIKMKRNILKTPFQITTFSPAEAIPLPTSPPMSAWLLDVGIANSHVMTFQIMAPTSVANKSGRVTCSTCTTPFPIIVATAVPNVKYPTKFAKPARNTA